MSKEELDKYEKHMLRKAWLNMCMRNIYRIYRFE